MTTYPELVAAWVQLKMRERDDLIEAACERMLTTPGSPGVLVIDNDDGSTEVSLSPYVPFGNIYYGRPGSFL